MKEFQGISSEVFDSFEQGNVPVFQKKEGNPRGHEAVEYSNTSALVQQIRVSFESILEQLSFEKNVIIIPEDGRACLYFSFQEEDFSLTRPQFMEFLCEQIRNQLTLQAESSEMYLLQYLFRHICWELMWKLDKKELGRSLKSGDTTIGRWKDDHPAFKDRRFPAETLNLFLEKKKKN